MKTTILALVFIQIAAFASSENEKNCVEKYFNLKNTISWYKKELVQDSYKNVFFFVTPISGTVLAASDAKSVMDADALVSDVDTMIQLYNESLLGEGATFQRYVNSIVRTPNLEVMSSTIVDLFEQNIFCSNVCKTFHVKENIMAESSAKFSSSMCLPEEAKHYILKEYAERMSSLKVN